MMERSPDAASLDTGLITGLATAMGGMLHTLPFLINNLTIANADGLYGRHLELFYDALYVSNL